MCLAFFPFKFEGGDLEEDIFQFSLVPTMLTIPPSAHFGWGPQGKRGVKGGGAPTNHELSLQATDTHFFIVVDEKSYVVVGLFCLISLGFVSLHWFLSFSEISDFCLI